MHSATARPGRAAVVAVLTLLLCAYVLPHVAGALGFSSRTCIPVGGNSSVGGESHVGDNSSVGNNSSVGDESPVGGCCTDTTVGGNSSVGGQSQVGDNSSVGACLAAPTTLSVSLVASAEIAASALSPRDDAITHQLISAPPDTTVAAIATLEGTNSVTATGSVTYSVYSDSACTQRVNTGTPEHIITPGTLPPSRPTTLKTPGTYSWQASYSGDAANAPSTSTCGADGSSIVISPLATPKPTTLTMTLSPGATSQHDGRWWHDEHTIAVLAGHSVTASATLDGANASSATGTVTYTVYAKDEQGSAVSSDTEAVTDGTIANSNPVTLDAGLYLWQASYSGDALNQASRSQIATEFVIPTRVRPPGCGHFRRQ